MSARRKALTNTSGPRLPTLSPNEWALLTERLTLSPRQQDILQLIMRGFQDRQIVAELGVSHATVRTHLRLLFARLGVSDRTELVLHAFAVLRGASSELTKQNC